MSKYPLSQAAVEAAASKLSWCGLEALARMLLEYPDPAADPAGYAAHSTAHAAALEAAAVSVLRAALAAWEPSDHQRRMAAALTGEPVSAASILAAVRTEAAE